MIPYAELVEALDRYRRRMGYAPAGSSLGGVAAAAPAAMAGGQAATSGSWPADDSTSVNARMEAAPPPPGFEDDVAEPPELSGSVDIGDGDILDEEPGV
ncbi:MAG: hypothetical protein IT370_21575 [Deltaproteobacteria bacterium]|nr:hypothetical protein [Deltaproteobacteria bacterium]